jgi:hypothetical protein
MIWLQATVGGLVLLVAILEITVLLAFRAGRFTSDHEGRLTDLARRMDRAGKLTSDLASTVQGLAVLRALNEQWIMESRTDRANLWQEIQRLRDK